MNTLVWVFLARFFLGLIRGLVGISKELRSFSYVKDYICLTAKSQTIRSVQCLSRIKGVPLTHHLSFRGKLRPSSESSATYEMAPPGLNQLSARLHRDVTGIADYCGSMSGYLPLNWPRLL